MVFSMLFWNDVDIMDCSESFKLNSSLKVSLLDFLYVFFWKIFVLNFSAETKAELQLYNLSYEYL